MPETVSPLSLGIIDASNCPPRMVFDDASRHIGHAVAHARRAFVREGKMAYVWRPPQPLRDEFRARALNETFWPMARSVSSWFGQKRSERTPKMISLGDSLGLPELAERNAIHDFFAEHRLEVVDKFNLIRPYLRAVHSSILAGQVSDKDHVAMRNDGYGYHSGQDDWPIHFDGSTSKMSDFSPIYRKDIKMRAVCVDQGEGTRLYDLSAHDIGGADCCDRTYARLKQSLVRDEPFLLSQAGDVVFIETGPRNFRQCFIHAAGVNEEVFIYEPEVPAEDFARLRTVRTYDFTVPLNRDDRRLQKKYWQNILGA